MATQLFKDIAHLVTNSTVGDGLLGVVEDAAFVVSDGLISWVGHSSDAPAADTDVSLAGRAVLPGFVDSHAHLVFAGDRDRKSTRLNSSHSQQSRMPSSA